MGKKAIIVGHGYGMAAAMAAAACAGIPAVVAQPKNKTEESGNLFDTMMNMPLAYDVGIPLMGTLNRKPGRKGVVTRKPQKKEVVVMTSAELSQLAGEAITKLFRKGI